MSFFSLFLPFFFFLYFPFFLFLSPFLSRPLSLSLVGSLAEWNESFKESWGRMVFKQFLRVKTLPVSEHIKFRLGNDMHCYIFYFYLKLNSCSFLYKKESPQKDFSRIISNFSKLDLESVLETGYNLFNRIFEYIMTG